MHVNKIPITSAAKTVVPNGHLIATSTDLTRRCNANPTEPKLGIFTYDYADDKSFNIHNFKKMTPFFSLFESIFTSHDGQQLLLLQQGRQTHLWLRLVHDRKPQQNEMPYVF
jgi:hypothetical protein